MNTQAAVLGSITTGIDRLFKRMGVSSRHNWRPYLTQTAPVDRPKQLLLTYTTYLQTDDEVEIL
jgi:hypothetical protein